MNNYKKLEDQEKHVIFENAWDDYQKSNKRKKLYISLAVAAMLFLSVFSFQFLPNHQSQMISSINHTINDSEELLATNLLNTDIYDDQELITLTTEDLTDLSNEDMDQILAQL